MVKKLPQGDSQSHLLIFFNIHITFLFYHPQNLDKEDTASTNSSSSSNLECRRCYRVFRTRDNFVSHVSTHGSSECRICFRVYRDYGKYLDHKKAHKSAQSAGKPSIVPKTEVIPEKPKCHICKKAFRFNVGLKIHMEKEHPNHIDVKGEPPIDAVSFTNEQKPIKAEEFHAKSEPEMELTCLVCEEKFDTEEYLLTHSLTSHKIFKCKICSEKFKKYSHLNEHHTACHNKTEGHVCKYCESSFRIKVSLGRHISHCPKKPRTCLVCDKTVVGLKAYQCHTLSHKAYKCFKCGKKERNYALLKYHSKTCSQNLNDNKIKEEEQEEENRSVAGTSASIEDNMQPVPLIETEDIKVGVIECFTCSYISESREKLQIHNETHDDKGKKCKICHIVAVSLDNLARHFERVHPSHRIEYDIVKTVPKQSDQPNVHQCKLCAKVFKFTIALKMHYKKDHPPKVEKVR